MRTKWLDPDFRREAKSDHRCIICGKALKAGRPFRTVRTETDGPNVWSAIHPADYSQAPATALVFAIGNDCAAKLGLEWSTEGN